MRTNLDSGPWKAVKAERRRLFVFYYRGHLAYLRGETIFAPPFWTDEEREQYHEGYKAAQRLAWEFRGGDA